MPATTFYRRRAARIIPVYTLCCVIGLVADAVTHRFPSAAVVITTLTFTQAWFPQTVHPWTLIDGPTWSLSCEAFFYLLLPAIIAPLSRLEKRTRRGVLLACVLFTICWSGLLGGLEPHWTQMWATSMFPLARLPEFIAGILLCYEISDGVRVRWSNAFAALVVGGLLIVLVPQDSTKVLAVAIIPSILVIGAAASGDLVRDRVVPRWLVILGTWSYALFLLHYPLMQLAGYGPWYSALVVALISVAGAGLIYEYFEKPLERRLSPPALGHVSPRLALAEGGSEVGSA
jgi:peptidoglycan/LPS O-acetylase OafA/YrhL